MLPLEQLQQQFLAMLTGDTMVTLGLSRISAPQSRRIYQRNYRETHIQALAETFVHVATLVGTDYFRQLAHRYVTANPSFSGDLNDYGADFPAFLEQLLPHAPAGEGLSYLPDIARLDWACFHALRAPCGNPHALSELTGWTELQQGNARMQLHPACTLIVSPYPLHRLWKLATGDAQTVDVDAGSEAVLVSRPGLEVQVSLLDTATACLIQQWQRQPLAASLQIVASRHPGTDFIRLLPTLAPLGAVGALWSHP